MQRLLVIGALVVAAVALAGGSASASGGSSSETTLRFLEVRTSVQQVDVGAPGTSAGDEFILGGRLRNLADTETRGHSSDVCTVLSDSGAPLHCVSVVWLSGGTLELAGAASGGPNFRLAITGGTRAYDTARGEVIASPGANGNEVLTFDID